MHAIHSARARLLNPASVFGVAKWLQMLTVASGAKVVTTIATTASVPNSIAVDRAPAGDGTLIYATIGARSRRCWSAISGG